MAVALEAVAAATEGRLHGDGGFAVERLVHPVEARGAGRTDLPDGCAPRRHAGGIARSRRGAAGRGGTARGRARRLGRGGRRRATRWPGWWRCSSRARMRRRACIRPRMSAGARFWGRASRSGRSCRSGRRRRSARARASSLTPRSGQGRAYRARLPDPCGRAHRRRRGAGSARASSCRPGAVIGADGFSYVTREPASFEVARRSGDFHGVVNERVRRIGSLGRVETRRRCGNRREQLHRPLECRRNPHRRAHQDRQSLPDRPQHHHWRGLPDLRQDGDRRQHAHRRPGGAGRRGHARRPYRDRRRRRGRAAPRPSGNPCPPARSGSAIRHRPKSVYLAAQGASGPHGPRRKPAPPPRRPRPHPRRRLRPGLTALFAQADSPISNSESRPPKSPPVSG